LITILPYTHVHIFKNKPSQPQRPAARTQRGQRKRKISPNRSENFFSMLAFFNHYSRNEPGEMFFPNLALLSRANPSSATYKGVTPVHLT
jgi:hypothetical protein